MNDDRLPKIICYSELQQGTRFCGGQRKGFKDCLKANFKKCDIEPNELEDLAADRSGWRSLCKDWVQHFEANRIQYLEAKRSQRKSRSTPNNTDFQCDICGRHVHQGSDCTHTAEVNCDRRSIHHHYTCKELQSIQVKRTADNWSWWQLERLQWAVRSWDVHSKDQSSTCTFLLGLGKSNALFHVGIT